MIICEIAFSIINKECSRAERACTPNWIVKYQSMVAVTPAIANARIRVNNQTWNA